MLSKKPEWEWVRSSREVWLSLGLRERGGRDVILQSPSQLLRGLLLPLSKLNSKSKFQQPQITKFYAQITYKIHTCITTFIITLDLCIHQAFIEHLLYVQQSVSRYYQVSGIFQSGSLLHGCPQETNGCSERSIKVLRKLKENLFQHINVPHYVASRINLICYLGMLLLQNSVTWGFLRV